MNRQFLAALTRPAVLIGAGGVILVLLIGGIVTARTAAARLERTIAARSEALRTMERLRGEAQQLQLQIRQVEAKLARSVGASPVNLVEGVANRIAGPGNLAYLRPIGTTGLEGLRVETLELKLERQSLEQVLRLIWDIENLPAAPARVSDLRLQRLFDNHARLDATLAVTVYSK